MRSPVDRHSLVWLMLTGFAAYSICLFYVPIDSDELALFSSVADATHPFGYFVGDWGLRNDLYRPLFSVTHWLQFRLFGVWGLPYQLLSLVLHLAVIGLVFELISHVGRHLSPAMRLLLAMVALVSPYTMAGASWTANRPSVMAALCLLLVVRHLCLGPSPPSAWYVAVLSIAAMLSKENGLTVPAFAAIYAWITRQPRLVSVSLLVIAGYLALRFAVFGASAASYPESGFLLGIRGYADSSTLNLRQFTVMLIENPLKHVVALALPVFNDEGALRYGADLWPDAELWLATVGLVVVCGRPRSRAQWLALVVILLNAVIHYAVFRFRTMYVAHLALVVYVAASPSLQSLWRRRLAVVLASVVLVSSVVSVERSLADVLAESYQGFPAEFDLMGQRIDPKIVAAVSQRYFP